MLQPSQTIQNSPEKSKERRSAYTGCFVSCRH